MRFNNVKEEGLIPFAHFKKQRS